LNYLWFEGILESDGVWYDTARIADAVNLPRSTAKMTLEDLMVVGALKRQRGGSGEAGGRPLYKWQIADDMADYIHAAEVFDV
jgi:predicted transcriptional regulator